jgi:hypothetical protein
MRPRFAVLSVLALCLPVPSPPAQAEEVRAGDIVVAEVWGRASVGSGAGALYLTLRNEGDAADRLVGAETPVAGRAELHVHSMDGDVARMRPAEGVDLPPGATVVLAPGGTHIMLMGLAAPLKAGDSVPVTLRFAAAGTVEATAAIGPIGAKGP